LTNEELCIDEMPGFEERLRERFPQIGPFEPGTGMASALELATLGLQAHAGCPVAFSRSVATAKNGVFLVVVEYTVEAVGRLAVDMAMELCIAAQDKLPFDLDDSFQRLRTLDEELRLGPSTGAIVAAAVARGIPYRRLTEGSLVQFGWGSKQRRIQAAEMDSTSAISESIAQDKELTKFLLAAGGVPVPKGRPVKDAEDAWAAACEIGLPVVVKPRDGNQGKGVTGNIDTREDVISAYNAAREISADVLIEKHLTGGDYRLLVIGGKFVAAARREPPLVIGDGEQTIRELVDEVNSDPRRSDGHATSLSKIQIDKIAVATLAKQGFDAESIPHRGARVFLRDNANLSTGGTATDITDDVHHDLAARAVDAANMVGLDLCGVDVVCESVFKPLDQSGGVIEVNAAPGLRMHLVPSFGKGRPVGEAIISALFAEHENGRIPVVAVSGNNGKTTTVRLIAHIIALTGKRTGMTNTDGVYISGKRIDTGDCSGPRSASNVLFHPEVDAAVLETARGGILRAGLGFDFCNVAVITNIGAGDHLGMNHINTVEELAIVKRVIVRSLLPDGVAVLNAADPLVAAMATACPGSVTFFAHDRNERLLANHLAQGKRGVFVDDDGNVVAGKGRLRYKVELSKIPLTRNGTIRFQVENVLAATAAVWALGIPWETIRQGLATFVSDAKTAPGRFNVFDHAGATIIADYGHNPDAIRGLVQAVENIPAKRRIVVISGAGDRRDCDLREQTEILGEAFDEVILYQDLCQRGRADGEVLALLRDGLANATRTKHFEEIYGEFLAIDTALSRLNAGDVCLILVDQIDEAIDHIQKRTTSA
jgi:cyanophycin synthetase